ncbi:hypothetical protein ANO11243_096160 [Dothideomycetidae sp. 11243]|nr:hypothetical protein ANO11243_096160 [fungal sp. No.11243]
MASTPPHHPTYNVRLDEADISDIIHLVDPSRTVLSVEQLESGRSFNNRIYFIRVTPSDDSNDATADIEDFVLKVSGQFFGPDKVQNEVACLHLIEHHCPPVPVPRVVAWCEGGKSALKVLTRFEDGQSNILTRSADTDAKRGWLLLSRVPGRPLETTDLDDKENGREIMQQLASIVTQLRTKIPTADRFGNIAISGLEQHRGSLHASLEVKGLILRHLIPDRPILTALEYYHIRLQDQLQKLETEPALTLLREKIAARVRHFTSHSLPTLPQSASKPTFTHYDFSPRNVLVSDCSPARVTGLVDFEFAGFFPAEEDFANTAVNNEGDWPADAYEWFLEGLEAYGVETPLRGFSEERWRGGE